MSGGRWRSAGRVGRRWCGTIALLAAGTAGALTLPPPGPTRPVSADCIQAASARYRVPALLILAILKTEGGRPGLAKRNRNGSYDLGPMQVNTLWVERHRLDARTLRDDGCYNVAVGTAILANELATAADLATGVGNYHSRTPRHHHRYRRQVMRTLRTIAQALKCSELNLSDAQTAIIAFCRPH